MTETTTNAEGTPTLEETITSLRAEVVNLREMNRRQDDNLVVLRNEHRHLQQHLEGLGDALRAKAIEKGWCEEYDEFAEEWDLPKRYLDFEVTMTLTVIASDEESALEFVRDNISITNYSENVQSGPEFEVSEA